MPPAYREILERAGLHRLPRVPPTSGRTRRSSGSSFDGVGVPAAHRGRRRRGHARPDAVLRRGRRPAGRHRPALRGRVLCRDHRRAEARAGAERAPRPRLPRRVTRDAAVSAQVDMERRSAISRSHTATHLVHAGMRKALGDSAAQAGSLNAPGRLRFDFTSPTGAVPTSVLADVEDEVNYGAARRRRGARLRHEHGRGPQARRRSRCSGRSTATPCASSRSATTPASSAAAPTCAGPVSSGW